MTHSRGTTLAVSLLALAGLGFSAGALAQSTEVGNDTTLDSDVSTDTGISSRSNDDTDVSDIDTDSSDNAITENGVGDSEGMGTTGAVDQDNVSDVPDDTGLDTNADVDAETDIGTDAGIESGTDISTN